MTKGHAYVGGIFQITQLVFSNQSQHQKCIRLLFFLFSISQSAKSQAIKINYSIIYCNHFMLMKLLGLIISNLFNSHSTVLVKFKKTKIIWCNSNSLLTVTPGDLVLCKIFHNTLMRSSLQS